MEIYIVFIVFNFEFLYKKLETNSNYILISMILFLYVELKDIYIITIIQLMNAILFNEIH